MVNFVVGQVFIHFSFSPSGVFSLPSVLRQEGELSVFFVKLVYEFSVEDVSAVLQTIDCKQ